MAKKKSALGRGLEVLLRDIHIQAPSATGVVHQALRDESSYVQNYEQLLYLPIESLQRGSYQPRQEIAEHTLAELAESIQSQGIIQPILVSKIGANRYEIIAGERRWRAAQKAQLDKVPVIVRNLDPKTAMAIALIENIQREDLNPLEVALGLQRLLQECDLTHQELAATLGKSRSTISNLLRLLELQNPIKQLLIEGLLEMGHARALLSLSSSQQLHIANQIITAQLSVRQTEKLVAKQQHVLKKKTSILLEKNFIDPNVASLQNALAEYLGASVFIKMKKKVKGHGELIIKYFSNDELCGILERILKEEQVN